MTSPIDIPVQAPGAADLSRIIAALAQQFEQLAVATDGTAAAEQRDTAATRENTASKTANADSSQVAATQAVAFGQRLAGVANAVQALTSQLGGQSHTAGLIGATLNSSVQFAQLGAALGPQGALVGGIIGAAIPALHELQQSFSDVAIRATHAGDSVEQMVARYTHMRDAVELTARLANGTATVEERITEATRAQAVYDQELANGVELQNRLNALRHDDNDGLRGLALVIPGVGAALDALHLQRGAEIEQLEAAVTQSQEHAAALRDEADAATELTRVMQPLTAAETAQAALDALEAEQDRRDRSGEAEDKHRGGGGTSPEDRADQQTESVRAALASVTQDSTATAAEVTALQEQFQHLWESAYDGSATYLEEQGQLIQQIHTLQDADAERSHQALQHAHDEQEAVAELARAKAEAREEDARASQKAAAQQAAADAQREKSLRLETQAHQHAQQEAAQATQARTQTAQQSTSSIISGLTTVFSALATGQANAAQAGELLLASFLQYISQRAEIEALAQVAEGLGSYPDAGGMALHFLAAAGWAAVAVATGVGGAALASDAQSKAAAATSQQPASPSGGTSSSSGTSAPANVTINFNNAVPMTQGQAAAAVRPLRRMIEQSTQRYPTS